ncbi:MAG: HAD hydrolase-like protein [Aquificae bacterium]|nr:HAD hydrolase-like protein [Aquificota bacterium]
MNIKGFLIDLDGVLTKDENFTPIEGAVEFIDYLNRNRIPYLIATSNSRFPPEEIIRRMRNNGFNLSPEKIITPLVVAPEVMKKEGVDTVFVIGSPQLIEFMEGKGFSVKQTPEVDSVLVGLDKGLNFEKLKIGTTALKVHGAKLYALNRNIISKDDDGLLFPGVGTVAKMFATACQCNGDFKHFGKMGPEYNKVAFEKLGIDNPGQICMISDDLFVDLKGYKSLGLKTVFVTTGKYTLGDAEGADFVDIIVDNLTQLIGRVNIIDSEN